jgi:2-polyprenyl-6-methoxyphenol hydroxylase-like FAD-dependent oxidoreductase
MTSTPAPRRHAIVIGASMAGLLAARVLADHFERVTVIERDPLPPAPQPRKGVPQGRHVHALLIRGERTIGALFPDLVPALEAQGAVRFNMGSELRWHHFGCWKAKFNSALHNLAVSRPCLEWEIAQRVARLPNVHIVDRCDVGGFATSADHTRMTGVVAQRRDAGAPAETMAADLVVDASGRGSQTPQRLAALGYGRPPESEVRVDFGYASRIYRVPPGTRDWKAMYMLARQPGKRGGLIFPIEGDRWMVTVCGWHRDHPPADEAGFLEFAASLPMPDLHRWIRRAEPLSDITAHGFPANWRRHYERMQRLPEGLAMIGDAVCSFNPVYGQGMTVAAIEASELDACLRRHDSLAHFQRAVGRIVDPAWQMTTGEDLRFAETRGERSAATRFLHWYTGKVHAAAGTSPLVAESFYAVMNMVAPPPTLFAPRVLLALTKAEASRQRAALARDNVALKQG